MSRIIITRHANGEECLTCGWDRQLQTAFVDLYDDGGDCVQTRGPCAGENVTIGEAAALVAEWAGPTIPDGVTEETIHALLRDHFPLDYPASNVKIDLSGGAR